MGLNAGENWVRAALLHQVRRVGRLTVKLEGNILLLVAPGDSGRVFALDNRCPHMGFPLEKGSLKDGILTCHWHHARFDLQSGGTFDLWADDVRSFPVQVRGNEVWVDLGSASQDRDYHRRLQMGLQRDLPLVIGKAVLSLSEAGEAGLKAAFQAGLEFGATYRRSGWGQGLTILTCMMNLLPSLDPADRPRALYHGLSAVASETGGSPPRFPIQPLPGAAPDFVTLKRWFRRFVEVRDSEGAERCLVTAIRAGAGERQMAEMLFAAATDHRYISAGHVADFTNKAFQALDITGWELAEPVLTSLAEGYAGAGRSEESNAWRNPIDLVDLLEQAFEQLPDALAAGSRVETEPEAWSFRSSLVQVLLGEDPQAIVDALLDSLRQGVSGEALAVAVKYAAALRIARFHTSNEFTDWDTALHTFTFANAIENGYLRAPTPETLRGVFDAAMSIYLDRFLNIPAARLPEEGEPAGDPQALLRELPGLLDRQQQVNPAGELAAAYLFSGGDPARLMTELGRLLLREDRDFHTIQTIDAAFVQARRQPYPVAQAHMLVAAARYLAAHSPTVRAQGQTYEIAYRLNRGERIYEE